MQPAKNQTIPRNKTRQVSLSLISINSLGEAIADYQGMVVNVPGGIPGELVEAQVEISQSGHATGYITRILKHSPKRVDAPCQYFGPCSGCQWQHIDYEHQLELKREIVEKALLSVPGLNKVQVLATLASADMWHYRNHARFTVSKSGHLGFVNRETHAFTQIERCMIMRPGINSILERLQGMCNNTTQVTIRTSVNGDSVLIQPILASQEIALDTGQPHYEEELQGHVFRISSPSFFQVNVPQAELIANLLKAYTHLSGKEFVVDAYAGVGTFACLLAPHSKRIIAIEESASAIQDTKLNAQGIPNLEICQGKAENILGTLQESPDLVILDPPRTGCHPNLILAIKRLRPKHVAYISCDVISLGRDLSALCEDTYRLDTIQPLDMFPHTRHIECVAFLTPEEGYTEGTLPLILASGSRRRYDILQNVGLSFQVVPSNIEEPLPSGQSPNEYVKNLALAKARRVTAYGLRGTVIAADTVVCDGEHILGKPQCPSEAEVMLRRLRGRDHSVVTGIAVIDTSTGITKSDTETSRVHMRYYSDLELQKYVSSGGSFDKAGGYGIQDTAFQPANSIEGCYLNIVGLPLCKLIALVSDIGGRIVPGQSWRPPKECQDCPLRSQENRS